MQFVSGESLQARIDRHGPLELCEILRIAMQVADGLSAAHQQGLCIVILNRRTSSLRRY